MHLVLCHQLRQVRQSAGEHPLVAGGALLDQRCGRIRCPTMTDQLFADQRQPDQPHVEHQRLTRSHKIDPWQVAAMILEMAGHKTHRLRIVAMRQRNTGIGRTSRSGSDTWDDLEGDALRSQFLDAMIFGALSTVLLWALDVRYFLFIGVFAGLANLVPYVGPVAGVVPAVIVSVLETGDVTKAMAVIGGYVGLKLLDDVLIQPLVVSRGVHLPPLVVFLSILIGGNLFGILGMLLAVPCAGFLRVVLQESVATYRKYRFS